jgi:hypothetical protein
MLFGATEPVEGDLVYVGEGEEPEEDSQVGNDDTEIPEPAKSNGEFLFDIATFATRS